MPSIFCAGAETSDVSECFATSGTVAANTGTQRTGNYCFKVSPAGTATFAGSGAIYEWWRVAFKISAQAAHSTIFVLQDSTPTVQATIGISAAYKLTAQAAGGTLQTGTTVLQAGVYYVLSVMFSSAASDVYVYLNGVFEVQSTDGTTSAVVTQLKASGFAAITLLYLDDVAVGYGDSVFAGQVDCIRPDGAGDDSADWTNTYAALAEAPTVDGTTHERVKAGSGASYFAHSLTTIASVGTINFVRLVVRYMRGSGAGSTHQARSKQGATTEDFTIAATTAYVNYFNALVTTTPTTQGLLDSLQAGVNHSGAQDSYVSEVWVMVDHTPAAGTQFTQALPAGMATFAGSMMRGKLVSGSLASFVASLPRVIGKKLGAT